MTGSAAGNTLNLSSCDPRMAYGAKIAVFDFRDTTSVKDFIPIAVDIYISLYDTGLVRTKFNSCWWLHIDYCTG